MADYPGAEFSDNTQDTSNDIPSDDTIANAADYNLIHDELRAVILDARAAFDTASTSRRTSLADLLGLMAGQLVKTTDDLEVVVEAASPGACLILEPGTHTVSSDIDISVSNLTIRGFGPASIIDWTSALAPTTGVIAPVDDGITLEDFAMTNSGGGADAAIFGAGANVTIRNLTLTDVGFVDITGNDFSVSYIDITIGSIFNTGDGSNISNNIVRSTDGFEAIGIIGTGHTICGNNLTVDDGGVGGIGFFTDETTDCVISKNIINKELSVTGGPPNEGIFLLGSVASQHLRNNISDNVINNFDAGITAPDLGLSVINGNVCANDNASILAGIGVDVDTNAPSDVTISNNTVTFGTSGISVSGDVVTSVERVTISGNTVLSTSVDGIFTSFVDHSTVVGNTIRDEPSGISAADCNTMTISGNVLEDAGQTGAGIDLADCAEITVCGNSVSTLTKNFDGIACSGCTSTAAVSNVVSGASGTGTEIIFSGVASATNSAIANTVSGGGGTITLNSADTGTTSNNNATTVA